jgi:putative endonuclease
MYYVYILLSLKDKKYYTGSTGDLRRRIVEHKSGKVRSTKNRLPVKLVCYEAYSTKLEAQRREKFLKSSDGKKDLRKRIIIENLI